MSTSYGNENLYRQHLEDGDTEGAKQHLPRPVDQLDQQIQDRVRRFGEEIESLIAQISEKNPSLSEEEATERAWDIIAKSSSRPL